MIEFRGKSEALVEQKEKPRPLDTLEILVGWAGDGISAEKEIARTRNMAELSQGRVTVHDAQAIHSKAELERLLAQFPDTNVLQLAAHGEEEGIHLGDDILRLADLIEIMKKMTTEQAKIALLNTCKSSPLARGLIEHSAAHIAIGGIGYISDRTAAMFAPPILNAFIEQMKDEKPSLVRAFVEQYTTYAIEGLSRDKFDIAGKTLTAERSIEERKKTVFELTIVGDAQMIKLKKEDSQSAHRAREALLAQWIEQQMSAPRMARISPRVATNFNDLPAIFNLCIDADGPYMPTPEELADLQNEFGPRGAKIITKFYEPSALAPRREPPSRGGEVDWDKLFAQRR